ncbi:MAG TPA: serine hydrolase domain-containing protein [Terriglobales bacterium]|nr:serine hydrolase domain-containing protein [Terriglobales bacterium]
MKILGGIVLLMMLGSKIGAAAVDPAKMDAIFTDLKSDTAPGGAVLVIKDGRAVFARGYGVTDLRTLGKIGVHTNFRLASVSKQFTAMAVMLLVHDGRLRYDDRLTDVFPDFPAYGRAITIRHLLNHTSGLQDYEDLMEPDNGASPEKIPQIKDAGVLALLKQQTSTKFVPGAKWEYSNSGYAVLAMVVEKVSGKAFGQFLQERIFGPLKMQSSIAYERGKNEVPHRAYGHARKEAGWQQTDQSSTSAVLGDGGIYSSLDDLAKWDDGLRHHRLLSEVEMRPAFTPGKLEPAGRRRYGPAGNALFRGKPAEYGFGWFLDSYKGHARMWHFGETVGFRTAFQRFVNDKLSIIVLCNREDVSAEELALRVADLYLRR